MIYPSMYVELIVVFIKIILNFIYLRLRTNHMKFGIESNQIELNHLIFDSLHSNLWFEHPLLIWIKLIWKPNEKIVHFNATTNFATLWFFLTWPIDSSKRGSPFIFKYNINLKFFIELNLKLRFDSNRFKIRLVRRLKYHKTFGYLIDLSPN